MSKYYVVADLHGRYDLYRQARDYFMDQGMDGDKFIITGDMVDRGPQSAQIIDNVMTLQDNFIPVIALKGNHEDMMHTVCNNPSQSNLNWWLGNGGGATLMSYGAEPGSSAYDAVELVSDLEWVNALPLMHVTDNYVFVHAGVDPSIPLAKQKPDHVLWELYRHNMHKGHGNKHVVHGHEQFEDGPKLFSGRTNLDTFAWFTGRLVMGVFDSEIGGGPIKLVEFKDNGTPIEIDSAVLSDFKIGKN